mmetsp:Transcript_13914/g.14442  ORF Transcript_13914/g.14442 Transcript_13914/m.14442 type:complete len:248 (-) Transcript_13914:38-781(-)
MIDKKHLAELLGTFIFSLGINMSTVYADHNQTPNVFSIISVLFVVITITRNISGGHINGAVSFGFMVDELKSPARYNARNSTSSAQAPFQNFVLYFIFQIIGSLLACTLSWLICQGHIMTFSSSTFTEGGIIYAEAIGTFIFVYNILVQSNNNKFTNNASISTLLIVLGLFTAINVTTTMSAGCINPSLVIGHTLTRFIFKSINEYEMFQFLMYLIGGFIGSLFAGLCYNGYYKDAVDEDKEDALNE